MYDQTASGLCVQMVTPFSEVKSMRQSRNPFMSAGWLASDYDKSRAISSILARTCTHGNKLNEKYLYVCSIFCSSSSSNVDGCIYLVVYDFNHIPIPRVAYDSGMIFNDEGG